MRSNTRLPLLVSVCSAFLSPVTNAAFSVKSLAEINVERRLITGTPVDVTQLVQVLARPGLTITNARILHGDPDQFGTFSGGADSIGIASGVIISTGGVGDVKGPNARNSTTGDFDREGYAPLDALLEPGTNTFDAAVVQIDFTCNSGVSEEFQLQYVWASEEYNEYVNEDFNDVFAFFLNGEDVSNNVATLPGGTAVAINSVNCGNPYNATSTGTNCDLFVNNELGTRTTEYNIEFDGFTVPLEVLSQTKTGSNTIILAVEDAGDDQYDSAMMLGAGTLSCGRLDATIAPTTARPVATTNAPTKAPTKSPTAAPVTGSKAPTEQPSAAPVEGSKSPTRQPTPKPSSPPVAPGPSPAPVPEPTSPLAPAGPAPTTQSGMTVRKCLAMVKDKCNCVLFAKGDDCATDVIRYDCKFSKSQREMGAKEKVLDGYAAYCEC